MGFSTLQSRINKLTFFSLSLVGVIFIGVIVIHAYVRHKITRDAFVENLKSSSVAQVQQILPTLLVFEQREGLALILDRIKGSEGLAEANFIVIEDLEEAKKKYSQCSFSTMATDCVVEDRVIVTVPISIAEKIYGYLLKSKKFSSFLAQGQQLYFLELMLLTLFVIFIVQFLSLSRLTSKEVPHSLSLLIDWVSSQLNGKDDKVSKPNLQFSEFNDLGEKISNLIKAYERQSVRAKIGTLASQVSHDIRSPLAALNLIIEDIALIPEEKRVIIRSAVNRINDIANQLLERGKELQAQGNLSVTNSRGDQSSNQLVAPMIESIVSEKRIQYREKQSVLIESDVADGYGLFANIDALEYKRVLSNLINNSVEALSDQSGIIKVKVKGSGNSIKISVVDNGKGIPSEIIEKLGLAQVSYGKLGTSSGSGLGILHARQIVDQSGGKLDIFSAVGKGSEINITLPRADAPSWFVEKLNVKSKATIVCLDDDISIHQLWRRKLEEKKLFSKGEINFLSFTSGRLFEEWVTEKVSLVEESIQDVVYLIDYELLGQERSGLDIIEYLDLGAQSILVTSHYEERSVLSRCSNIGTRLIPKAMVGFVCIELADDVKRRNFDSVIIDDDPIMHSIWKVDAAKRNKEIISFYDVDSFMKVARTISFDAKIFIDSDLKCLKKGEEFAKEIYSNGFRNLYLSTGYPSTHFEKTPFIKEIVGKNPSELNY